METKVQLTTGSKTEFDFSKIRLNTKYNILIHCVYDPFNQFDTEFAFLDTLGSDTLLILWHPVEIGVWDQVWIDRLNHYTNKFKILYLTGCSHRLNLHDHFDIKFDVEFFPVFDIRAGDIFPLPGKINTIKQNKFMFINSKDTAHRRYVLGTLMKNNLINQGIVSYRCAEGKIDYKPDFNIHCYNPDILSHTEKLFNLTDSVIPIILKDKEIGVYLPSQLFLDCYLGIIGETHFTNLPFSFNTSFVTEKTFLAIANNQMFIVVGHAGSLELVRSLGYRTFDKVIDETYDTILDNSNRLDCVNKEIVRFINRPIEQIQADYQQVEDIINYNRDRLYSQNLNSRLQDVVDQY